MVLNTRQKERTIFLAALILICFIFRGWLYPGVITFGDWGYHYREDIPDFLRFSLWNDTWDAGWVHPDFYKPIEFLAALTAKILNVDFSVVEKLFWYIPFLFLAVFSISYLWKTLLKEKYALGIFFAVLIYRKVLVLSLLRLWLPADQL